MKRYFLMTPLLLIVTGTSLLLGVNSYIWKERELRRRIYVEESLVRLTRAKTLLENELETEKGKAAILERQLVSMQRTNRFTLVRLRNLERRFSTMREDFAQMETSKNSLESEVASLRGQLNLASSEAKGVQNRVNRLLIRSPQEVDLGQIVVSATPNLEGRVIAVNQPFQFVVIDLGSEKNLPVGAVLSIYRQSDFIGRIQVEEIRESVAACRILPEWTRQEIKENDLVKEL